MTVAEQKAVFANALSGLTGDNDLTLAEKLEVFRAVRGKVAKIDRLVSRYQEQMTLQGLAAAIDATINGTEEV